MADFTRVLSQFFSLTQPSDAGKTGQISLQKALLLVLQNPVNKSLNLLTYFETHSRINIGFLRDPIFLKCLKTLHTVIYFFLYGLSFKSDQDLTSKETFKMRFCCFIRIINENIEYVCSGLPHLPLPKLRARMRSLIILYKAKGKHILYIFPFASKCSKSKDRC